MAMSPAVTADSLTYYLTGEAVAPRPTTWKLSVHTGDPGTDGTANEAAFSGYARQDVSFDVDASVVGEEAATNDADVTFAANPAEYVVTHVVVWGGSIPLVIQALANPKTIPASTSAVLAAGELIIGGRN